MTTPTQNLNTGHGHVRPRPDGVKARCGGPAMCRVCKDEAAALAQPQPSAPDYEAVLADHRRLVRELDVLLNGDGAAAQASLCDLVSQVAAMKAQPSAPSVEPLPIEAIHAALMEICTDSSAPETLEEFIRDEGCADLVKFARAVERRLGTAPTAQAPQPPKFNTTKAGRGEVARFFREHLKRHDFSDYIANKLAADFACALAPTLHAVMAGAAPLMANGLTESDGDNRHCRDCADFGPICPNSGEPCSGGAPQAAPPAVLDRSDIARASAPAVAAPEPVAPQFLHRMALALEVAGSEWRVSDPNLRIDIAAAINAQQSAALLPAREPLTLAARDVLAERQRQISAEGWTPEHDDEHNDGEMARAASVYANPEIWNILGQSPVGWPWYAQEFKPSGPRRNLIKAGALILAEIERLDRAAGITAAPAAKGEAL